MYNKLKVWLKREIILLIDLIPFNVSSYSFLECVLFYVWQSIIYLNVTLIVSQLAIRLLHFREFLRHLWFNMNFHSEISQIKRVPQKIRKSWSQSAIDVIIYDKRVKITNYRGYLSELHNQLENPCLNGI